MSRVRRLQIPLQGRERRIHLADTQGGHHTRFQNATRCNPNACAPQHMKFSEMFRAEYTSLYISKTQWTGNLHCFNWRSSAVGPQRGLGFSNPKFSNPSVPFLLFSGRSYSNGGRRAAPGAQASWKRRVFSAHHTSGAPPCVGGSSIRYCEGCNVQVGACQGRKRGGYESFKLE